MPPIFTLRNDDDSTAVTSFTFSGLEAGVSATPLEVHVWNDYAGAGADDATGVLIGYASRDVGDTGPFTQTHPFAANRMLQLRASGIVGTDAVDQDTGFKACGKGSLLSVNDIPAGSGRKLFLEPLIQPGLGAITAEVLLFVRSNSVAVPLEQGHFESGAQGILTGIGDGSFSWLFDGAVCTPSGSPDDKVHVTDISGVAKGKAYCDIEHDETFTNADSVAATLAGGEAYPVTLTRGPSGVVQNKGPKATAPLDPTTFPAVPADHVFIAHITVPFGLVIDTPEIDQTGIEYGFHKVTYSGLNALCSPGDAMVGNSVQYHRTQGTVALTASLVNTIWLLPTGARDKTTDGTKPHPQALAIAEATCDGSSVTSSRDLRTWIGGRRQTLALTVDNSGGLTNPTNGALRIFESQADGYIFVSRDSIFAGVDDAGATSGATIADVEYLTPAGGTWTSLYTSSGTHDRRATIPYTAADPATASGSNCDIHFIPAGTMFRAVVKGVPGSSAPKRLVVNVTIYIP